MASQTHQRTGFSNRRIAPIASDEPFLGDYDGDGKADLAVYRDGATTGAQSTVWIKKSTDSSMVVYAWGIRGDKAIPGDFDGDGKMDINVARVVPATGESTAYILRSSDSQLETKPIPYPLAFIVPGDYDGDGKTDIATIKSSINDMLWTIIRSSDDVTENIRCGVFSSDYQVAGDYNGDGKTDLAIWRKTGTGPGNPASFWIRQPDGSYMVVPFGNGLDSSMASIRVY